MTVWFSTIKSQADARCEELATKLARGELTAEQFTEQYVAQRTRYYTFEMKRQAAAGVS